MVASSLILNGRCSMSGTRSRLQYVELLSLIKPSNSVIQVATGRKTATLGVVALRSDGNITNASYDLG